MNHITVSYARAKSTTNANNATINTLIHFPSRLALFCCIIKIIQVGCFDWINTVRKSLQFLTSWNIIHLGYKYIYKMCFLLTLVELFCHQGRGDIIIGCLSFTHWLKSIIGISTFLYHFGTSSSQRFCGLMSSVH